MCTAEVHISIDAPVMTALHGCSLIKVFLPRIDPLAQILQRSFHIIQTLPHRINAHTSAPQKVPAFIAFVRTTRRLVQNIVTMCSISPRAAHSAVSAIATALPGSNAKCPTPPLARMEKALNRCSAVTSVRLPRHVMGRRAVSGSASDFKWGRLF